ncbi:uncharacterized protein cubi_00142 [Cryptosporidium ubiquitum]|uniref:Uncharacterized protein n=1 Tax=Cryptosporidium ubiquitum TaxID=857276 RepID=A0A1J4MNY9_9CRYT|nr:uncharacterized protein cubi_00142 [Cryptosporidium ubiquitum]OII74589.1 hypothetical protein cubi_00142 [Cryptosporidium ubiquitum]
MEFSSSEFLEKVIPCSEKLEILLEKYISECVFWNEMDQVLELSKQKIKKFSEELSKIEISKTDIIHSIMLLLIKREGLNDEYKINMKKDRQILIICTSTLFLVNSGYFDIVFWLDIILDISGLFKVHGLVAFTRWICGCFEEFNWSISNPGVPFDKRGLPQEDFGSVTQQTPGGDLSPSVAAQRQLAQAKFVGLLKVISRRLIGYHCLIEAGMLRSFVFSILPSNQAGICRKVFTPRVYSSLYIDEQLESIFEASTLIDDLEAYSDNDTDKEEGEMSNEKEDAQPYLVKSDFKHLLKPSKYVKSAFEAYKRVDNFFQTSADFLNSMIDNSETLSSNKKKQIDDICKDIEIVVSYFEDYKCVDVQDPVIYFQRLNSILEGIPSSLESYYFRTNFAYRFSFIVCCQLNQVIDGCKHACEHMYNKMVPLLQRCLGSIDKLKNKNLPFVTLFINQMIKYEFIWQVWKNNNCVDVSIPLEKLKLFGITKFSTEERYDCKKRKIEENESVTKFIDDETFNNYMYFIHNYSNSDCIEDLHSVKIRNVNFPNFTTERELLYLDPIDLDSYSSKSVNSKIANKFNDYKEKILIDLDPNNEIDESEKSIKDPIIRWRCNRLHKRIHLDCLNKLSDIQLSINNIESLIKNCEIEESKEVPLETSKFEFLSIYPSPVNN